MPYTAARENGPSRSLQQKIPGDTQGWPLGFWSRGNKWSKAYYTPTKKEILSVFEGVQAASEVIDTEAQILLAPVLGWMFKGKFPSTHHAADATWSKWVMLFTQLAWIGNPSHPGILKIIMNWPKGENFRLSSEEEEAHMMHAEEAPSYNQVTENEKWHTLFTDSSCHIVGTNWKWKAAELSPVWWAAEATKGQGESSRVAELKAVQLTLDIAERDKGPKFYLYTYLWIVGNVLWGWLEQWKKTNWHLRSKHIWDAKVWQDITTQVEKLALKVHHTDAHIPKHWATEEHCNNGQVEQVAKIQLS